MKYTTSIHPGTFDLSIGEFDENGKPVYDKFERYDIDVLEVAMQSKINSEEEVKQLSAQLYPEVIEVLGDNPYMGIRVLLDRTIKFIFANGDTPIDFERSMRRGYTAMKLDLDIFGLEKENG